MKTLTLSLLAGGAAALVSLAPLAVARAQDEPPTVAAEHGNWTLAQREHWLDNRLDKAKDDGSIDHHEADRVKHELHDIHEDEERMRDHHDGQLTDNETAALETRLDAVADKIHWLHENSFRRPW
ncbi:MAG: hypothetical protein ACYC8V_08965 [Caulobacteraceae bacterium]